METRDLHPDEISNKNLLEHIRGADGGLPPTFVGMTFVRYVKEGKGLDSKFTWAIYISHDPCHDNARKRSVLGDDRSTVIAFHRSKGTFRIIGRELPKKLALKLARGDLLKIKV